MKYSPSSVAFCGTVLVLLLSSFAITSYAQDDFKPKLGIIDKESVEMTAYPGDSTADAVCLYDYGNVNFAYDEHRGFYSKMQCWVRIKILKESALDRASVTLGFTDASSYMKSEAIEEITGYTYNLNEGKLTTTQMDKKSVKREKISDTYGAYKFNLPNVRKGSVIEYSYTRITPFTIQDKPDTWSFQTSIPVKWSEYKIRIPQYLDYQMIMGGYLSLAKSEREPVNINIGHTELDSPGMSYRFVMKDAPAFKNEPFITTEKDYLSKISFELSSIAIPGEIVKNYSQTWEHVDDTFMSSTWFGGELKKNIFEKEVTGEILKTAKDSLGKMDLGYAFIRKNMKWDSKNMSSKGGIKKAFENKKGSTVEINLLLTNLLRELGLDCDPVVLSTRSNGQIREHLPSLEGFNYVVSHVKIGDRDYLLDATQSYTSAGMLPKHAINGRGRVVPKRGPGYFIDLKPRELKNKLEMVEADIFPAEGRIKGSYSQSFAGYGALDWRDQHAQETDQDFIAGFKKELPEWKVENVVVTNKAEKLSASVNVKCDFEIEDENASEQLFYFNPMLAAGMHENPLKSPERIYPLDLTTGMISSFSGTFKLPDGYVLEEVPKSEIITLPDKAGRFLYQVKQTGNVIQVNSSMTVNKLIFLSDEYANLREFFERIVQKHAQPLVIKKKTE